MGLEDTKLISFSGTLRVSKNANDAEIRSSLEKWAKSEHSGGFHFLAQSSEYNRMLFEHADKMRLHYTSVEESIVEIDTPVLVDWNDETYLVTHKQIITQEVSLGTKVCKYCHKPLERFSSDNIEIKTEYTKETGKYCCIEHAMLQYKEHRSKFVSKK